MALERAGFAVVGAFADAESVLVNAHELAPAVALLDIELGAGISGVEAGIQLRRLMPSIGIVLLSNYTSPELVAALPADVAGGWSYLSKRTVGNVDALSRAIIGAADGLVVFDVALMGSGSLRADSPLRRLSARQCEIVGLMAQGYSNRAIAQRLTLTEKSVENHITRIYQQVHIDAHDPATHQRVEIALLYVDGVDASKESTVSSGVWEKSSYH